MNLKDLNKINKPYLNALQRAEERMRALDKREELLLMRLKEIEALKNYYNVVVEENEKSIDANYAYWEKKGEL